MGRSKEQMILEAKGNMAPLRREAEKTKTSFEKMTAGMESGVTKLNQGLELLEKAFQGLQKAAEFGKFASDFTRLEKTVDRVFVEKLQTAMGGTISKFDTMKFAAANMRGELKLNETQMLVLARAADDLGKGGVKPTEEIFRQLHLELLKGGGEAFAEYGIKIDTTKTKAEQFRGAMSQLEEIGRRGMFSDAHLDNIDKMKAKMQDAADTLKKKFGEFFNFILASLGETLTMFGEWIDGLVGAQERGVKQIRREDVREAVVEEMVRLKKREVIQRGRAVGFSPGAIFGETDREVTRLKTGIALGKFEDEINKKVAEGMAISLPALAQKLNDAAVRIATGKGGMGDIPFATAPSSSSVSKSLRTFGGSERAGASSFLGSGDTLISGTFAQDASAQLMERMKINADERTEMRKKEIEERRELAQVREQEAAAEEQRFFNQTQGATAAIAAAGQLLGKEKEFARIGAGVKVVEELAKAKSAFAVPGMQAQGVAHLIAAAAWAKVAVTAGGGGGAGGAGIPGGGFMSAGNVGAPGGGGNIIVQVGEGFVGDPHKLAQEIDERLRGARRAKRLNENSATSFE